MLPSQQNNVGFWARLPERLAASDEAAALAAGALHAGGQPAQQAAGQLLRGSLLCDMNKSVNYAERE